MTSYLYFEHAGGQYALPAHLLVKTISSTPIIVPVPKAQPAVMGIWPLGQHLVTVLDFGQLQQLGPCKTAGHYLAVKAGGIVIWQVEQLREMTDKLAPATNLVEPSHLWPVTDCRLTPYRLAEHLIFPLGPVWFALAVANVIQVCDLEDYPWQPVQGISFLAGLLHYHGTWLPVLHSGHLLEQPLPAQRRILVLKTPNGLGGLLVPHQLKFSVLEGQGAVIATALSRFPRPLAPRLVIMQRKPIWLLATEALFPPKLTTFLAQITSRASIEEQNV